MELMLHTQLCWISGVITTEECDIPFSFWPRGISHSSGGNESWYPTQKWAIFV